MRGITAVVLLAAGVSAGATERFVDRVQDIGFDIVVRERSDHRDTVCHECDGVVLQIACRNGMSMFIGTFYKFHHTFSHYLQILKLTHKKNVVLFHKHICYLFQFFVRFR